MIEESNVYAELLNVIQTYFEGMTQPDESKLRSIFHPDAQLFGIFDGNPVVFPLDVWINRVTGDPKPAADAKLSSAPSDGNEWRVQSIEVRETVARIEVVDRFLEVWYTDFMTLLRMEDGWRIVNKTFTYEKA